MFTSSDYRAKTVASGLFVAAAAVSFILGFWCMAHVSFSVGLIVLALLLTVSVAQHLFVTAYGDMVREAITNKKAYLDLQFAVKRDALLAARSQNADHQVKPLYTILPKEQAPAKTYPTVKAIVLDDREVKCPCCGLKQWSNRTRCFDCGAYFEK